MRPPRVIAARLAAALLAACARDVTEPSVAPPPDGPAFVLLAPGTVAQLTAGGRYRCGVRSDGTVACWGANDFGQATPPEGTFTQVSAGGGFLRGHTCGLRPG